jgi:RNA polymerase sigma-70 factor (ECF subfamily)
MLPRTWTGCGDRGRGAAGAPRPDADLIAELRAPDSDALAVLIGRYVRLVRRVAAGILRDEAEAEDVAQEVFFEIYRKAHLYDPARGPVRVWLLQDALRRRAAYRGESLDEVDALARVPRTPLTREESRWLIRTGLAQLPERQRATLELACLQEMSLRDVADRLRVSVGCARHYYYRGLTRLRAWARCADAGQPPPTARRPCRSRSSSPRAPSSRRPPASDVAGGVNGAIDRWSTSARALACVRHDDRVPLD